MLVADNPNWAYHTIQQFVRRHLSDEFDIYLDFVKYNPAKRSKRPLKWLIDQKEKRKFQVLSMDGKYDLVVYLAFYFPEIIKQQWQAPKTILGVFTDGFPPQNGQFQGNIKEFSDYYFSNVEGVLAGSPSIYRLFQNVVPEHKLFEANQAYDTSLFQRKQPKKRNTDSKFIVGWTGMASRTFKGYYTHIIPAVEIAQKKYPGIQLKSRFSGPFETLPDFFIDVDVAVIASDADAGPSLFFEASLMDVPCISTKIGLVQEVLEDGINGFYIDKDIEAIAERIIKLYEDRDLLFDMSQRIREDFLDKLGPEVMIAKWKNMFNTVLNIDSK